MCFSFTYCLIVFFTSLLLLCSPPTVGAASDQCPEGWEDVTDLGLGCLYFEFTGMTFHAANKFCYERNSHMVEVYDSLQMDFIVTRLQVLLITLVSLVST